MMSNDKLSVYLKILILTDLKMKFISRETCILFILFYLATFILTINHMSTGTKLTSVMMML